MGSAAPGTRPASPTGPVRLNGSGALREWGHVCTPPSVPLPYDQSLPAGARLRRRHRFYRTLLVLTLLVMISLAVPSSLRVLGAIGYNLICFLLVVELGGRSRQAAEAKRWDLPYRLLGAAAIISQWFWYVTPVANRQSGLPLLVLITLFIGLSLVRLVGFLAEERTVNGQVLMGATAGYLLLGLTAGLLVTALETVQPGSFSSLSNPQGLLQAAGATGYPQTKVWELDFVYLNYFAFVSLTTVGFGDVLPRTPMAQMTSIALSVIGPIYMAMVMGLLISRFTMQEVREGSGEDPPERREPIR